MADVTLKIIADASNAIKGIKNTQDATQKLADVAKTLDNRMTEVFKKAGKGFSNIEALKAYEKEMNDLKNALTEVQAEEKKLIESQKKLNEEQKKGSNEAEKNTSKLTQSMVKLGAAIVSAFSVRAIWEWIKVTAIAYDQSIQAEKKLLNAVEGRERVQKRLLNQAKEIQRTTIFSDEDVINAQAFLAAQGRTEEQIKKTISAAVQLASVTGTDLQSATEKLSMTWEGQLGRLGRLDGRLKALTTEQLLNGEAVDLLGEKYKGFAEIAATEGLGSLKTLNNAWGDLKETYGKVWVELLRLSGASGTAKELMEGTNLILKDESIPLWKRWLSFFGYNTKEVIAQAVKDNIKEQKELVKTQEENDQELIEQRKKFYETLNALNKKQSDKEKADEAFKQLQEQYLGYRDLFFTQIDQMNEDKEKQWEFDLEIGKKNFTALQREGKKVWDKMIADEKAFNDASEKLARQKAKNYQIIGESIVDFISILDELSQREVDYYQRQRELLDTRIDETQQGLQAEIELYESGYASNVAAKQKELEELKKARAKALKDEELARKKEHALRIASLVAQKAVDIAKVISSSAVAKAEAYALMGNPVTLAAGIALLAAVKVSQTISIAAITAAVIAASASKYAKGGWTGEGKQKDVTGERMAGIVHEREFVIRRGPAHKFRDVLEAINRDDKRAIFTSFNKLHSDLVGGTTINKVFVENEGPNKRLDEVNAQLRQLNKKQSREEIIELSNTRIIRKGSTTRIINK